MPSINSGRNATPSNAFSTRTEEQQAYDREGNNQEGSSSSGPQALSLPGSPNHEVDSFDLTGQVGPPGTKPKISAGLWEDEATLYFKVYVNDICVPRREDNHMINGSQLLAVADMPPGQRDEFLESEKVKHVATIAPTHLIGTWIPFERALEIANKEKITQRLYPLFVYDIGALLYQPSNQPGEASLSAGGVKFATIHSSQEVATQERNVRSVRESSIDPQNDTLLFEVGPIGSLFNSLLELLGLILIDIRTQPNMSEHHQSLESSCAAFLFWGTDHGVSQGELDEALQDSAQLRDTCLMALTSIGQFLMSSFTPLLSDKRQLDEIVNSTGIQKPLEQAMSILENQHDPAYRPDQDKESLCQTLRMKIDTLIMLDSSLASPAEENFDNEEPRVIGYAEKHLPEQAYINSVAEKFPLAASTIVTHLGKLNWERYNHMIRLQRNAIQQEIETTVKDKAKTIFHDSGLGNSLTAQSEAGAANRSESVYAPSVASTRAEASHRRLPPLPSQARSGQPFTCEICNMQVQYQRTKPWKKHIFNDILAYACFYEECSLANVFLEDPEALMSHLEKHHKLDVSISQVTCPLCTNYTSCDRGALALHLARHMEEIALAILPSGVDSDDEPVADTPVETDSEEQEDEPSATTLEPNPYAQVDSPNSAPAPMLEPEPLEFKPNAQVDSSRGQLPPLLSPVHSPLANPYQLPDTLSPTSYSPRPEYFSDYIPPRAVEPRKPNLMSLLNDDGSDNEPRNLIAEESPSRAPDALADSYRLREPTDNSSISPSAFPSHYPSGYPDDELSDFGALDPEFSELLPIDPSTITDPAIKIWPGMHQHQANLAKAKAASMHNSREPDHEHGHDLDRQGIRLPPFQLPSLRDGLEGYPRPRDPRDDLTNSSAMQSRGVAQLQQAKANPEDLTLKLPPQEYSPPPQQPLTQVDWAQSGVPRRYKKDFHRQVKLLYAQIDTSMSAGNMPGNEFDELTQHVQNAQQKSIEEYAQSLANQHRVALNNTSSPQAMDSGMQEGRRQHRSYNAPEQPDAQGYGGMTAENMPGNHFGEIAQQGQNAQQSNIEAYAQNLANQHREALNKPLSPKP